jgi:hypothetical protein
VNDKHWHRFSKAALPVFYLRLTFMKGWILNENGLEQVPGRFNK